ncbi:MAG: hypothetical protein WC916_01720 [Candidatus Woesearchaeota archaeon]
MRDVVLVHGNENAFIATAIKLGCSELVFLSTNPSYTYKSIHSNIRIKTAYLLNNHNELPRVRHKFDFLFARADRQGFEAPVDYIVGLESGEGKDSMHYRNTHLNQVHARIAKINNTRIALDFGLLRSSSNHERQMLYGRMLQDAVLLRKHKLSTEVFSFARHPIELIDSQSREALARILGVKTVK